MSVAGRALAFITDLVVDGYKIVGIAAPTLSVAFTVAKFLEVPMTGLKELSYAWEFLPVVVWLAVAYSRRWLHSRAEAAQAAQRIAELQSRVDQRERDKRAIGSGIRDELHELRFRLMCAAHMVAIRTGTSDREFLNWMLPITREYQGLHPKDNILKAAEMMLELSDAQLAALNAHEKKTKEGVSLALKKYQLPFLESQIHALGMFDLNFQKIAMEARAQLTSINEDVDQMRFYFEKTFDSSLSQGNHRIACEMVDSLTMTFGKRARQLVDLIAKLPAIE